MADSETSSANFYWPKLRTGGALGALLVLIGAIFAFFETIVFGAPKAEWGFAILSVALFLLFVSVCVDLFVFLIQFVWRGLKWGWARLFR